MSLILILKVFSSGDREQAKECAQVSAAPLY